MLREVDEFKAKFEELIKMTRNPRQLEMFNKIEFLESREMERSFDFQAGKYIKDLADDFEEKFLNENLYIDLKGKEKIREDFSKRSRTTKEDEKVVEPAPGKPLNQFINKWFYF